MKISDQIRNQILKDHSLGIKSLKTQKRLGVSNSFVRSVYKSNGLKWICSVHRKYSTNHNFFNKIDSEEKAYIVGLIFADGNVTNRSVRLSLKGEDKYILEKILECLGHEGTPKLRVLKDKHYYSISIWSKQIVSDLNQIGLNSDKTLNPTFPNIPDCLMRHFIRGFFDGDGCAYTSKSGSLKSTCRFYCHKKIVPNIRHVLNTLNLTSQISDHHRTEFLKSVGFTGNKKCFKFLTWLYFKSTIFLRRKKEKLSILEAYYSIIGPNYINQVHQELGTHTW